MAEAGKKRMFFACVINSHAYVYVMFASIASALGVFAFAMERRSGVLGSVDTPIFSLPQRLTEASLAL